MNMYEIWYSTGEPWRYDSNALTYPEAIIRAGRLMQEIKGRFSADYFKTNVGGVRIQRTEVKDQWVIE